MRMRFTLDEREQFTPGTKVEVKNGRYWYPAEIIRSHRAGSIIPTRSLYGTETRATDELECQILSTCGRKGTVSYADIITARPGNVRPLC